MTSTDRLEPWHIKHYLLYTEQVTCRCGHISAHERLWIHYESNRATTTRPLGLSEQIYAGVEVKHATKEFHTRACHACISSAPREAWSMPTPTPAPERSNVLAQLRASERSQPTCLAHRISEISATTMSRETTQRIMSIMTSAASAGHYAYAPSSAQPERGSMQLASASPSTSSERSLCR